MHRLEKKSPVSNSLVSQVVKVKPGSVDAAQSCGTTEMDFANRALCLAIGKRQS